MYRLLESACALDLMLELEGDGLCVALPLRHYLKQTSRP